MKTVKEKYCLVGGEGTLCRVVAREAVFFAVSSSNYCERNIINPRISPLGAYLYLLSGLIRGEGLFKGNYETL